MLLYKYRNRSHTMFTGCEIVFSPVSKFNDPYECAPAILNAEDKAIYDKRVQDLLRECATIRWRKNGHRAPVTEDFVQEMVGQWLEPRTGTVSDGIPIELDLFWQLVWTDLESGVGVFSLSEKRDNALMWGHYADGHRGCVVGFDPTHDYFRPGDRIYGRPLKVRYCTQRPSWSWVTMRPENWYLTKSADWMYEKEWRVLRRLSDGSRDLDPLETFEVQQQRVFQYPPAAVKEIIYGARMPEEERIQLWGEVNEHGGFGHVTFLEARLGTTTDYDLEIQEVP